MGDARRALVAKHASTLSAVMTTFEKRKGHATEKVVTSGRQRVRLPERLGETDGKMFVGAEGGWGRGMGSPGRRGFGQRRRVRGVVVREDAVGARDLCLGDGEGSGEHRHD